MPTLFDKIYVCLALVLLESCASLANPKGILAQFETNGDLQKNVKNSNFFFFANVIILCCNYFLGHYQCRTLQ